VRLHDGVLLIGELRRLVEDRVGDADLADVVQQAGEPHAPEPLAGEAELGRDRGGELRNRLAVAAGVGVLRVDGAGQRARQRARVVLVLGDRVAGRQLEVGVVDRDVLVDALGADEGEVGLADEVVARAQSERLRDPGGRGERRAVGAVARERPDALGELRRAERAGAGRMTASSSPPIR
jgi:hypothetical protein